MIGKAAEAIKEDWETGEVMLTPRQTQEVAQMIRDIKKYTRTVEEIEKNFERVSDSRKVAETPA